MKLGEKRGNSIFCKDKKAIAVKKEQELLEKATPMLLRVNRASRLL